MVLSWSPPGNVIGQRAFDAGVSHPFMLEVGEEVQSVWGHLIYFQMDAFVETSSFPVVLNFSYSPKSSRSKGTSLTREVI